jgi:hypothetical protein
MGKRKVGGCCGWVRLGEGWVWGAEDGRWAPNRRRLGYPYSMNTSRIIPMVFYSYGGSSKGHCATRAQISGRRVKGGPVTRTLQTYLTPAH